MVTKNAVFMRSVAFRKRLCEGLRLRGLSLLDYRDDSMIIFCMKKVRSTLVRSGVQMVAKTVMVYSRGCREFKIAY